MRTVRFLPLVVLAALSLPPTGAPLAAQGVTYTSVTSTKAGGALGAVLKLSGSSNITSTTYLSGHKMRVDDKDRSTIYDIDGSRIIYIDHKQKGYAIVTFEQLRAALDSGLAAAKQEQAKAKEKEKPKDANAKDYQLDYNVAVDRTNEHQKIAGYDAQRMFMTISMGAHEKGQEARADQGQMVLLVDLWTSTSAPQAAAFREFGRAYAAKMGQEFRSSMKGLEAAFSSNPQMKSSLEAAGKEMAKNQGFTLRNTSYFVIVPEGKTFDRQLALNAGAKADAEAKADAGQPKKGGGLFGKLKAAAAAAEQQQKEQQEQGGGKSAPQQATMMGLSTEVQDIQTGVPGDAFAIPAGYKEVPWRGAH